MTIDRKTTKPFHVFNFVTSIKPLLILDFEFYHFVFPKSRKKFNRQISDPFLALVEIIQLLVIFLFTEVAIFYDQRVQFALVPFMFYGKNTHFNALRGEPEARGQSKLTGIKSRFNGFQSDFKWLERITGNFHCTLVLNFFCWVDIKINLVILFLIMHAWKQ